MNVIETRWSWRRDLQEFRHLSDEDKMGYLLVLEWFESFRLRHGLEAERESAKIFWKNEVKCHGRKRESWQLTQWEAAIHWYLRWLAACVEAKAGHEILSERVRIAVRSAGVRRGLAPRTRQAYSAWAARYAAFAGNAPAALEVETATRFLRLVIEERDCAWSTKKQALNALAFFFEFVCGMTDPDFGVKLRKAENGHSVESSNEEMREGQFGGGGTIRRAEKTQDSGPAARRAPIKRRVKSLRAREKRPPVLARSPLSAGRLAVFNLSPATVARLHFNHSSARHRRAPLRFP